MKTEADFRTVADVTTVAEDPERPDGPNPAHGPHGVVAVAVERDDRTCTLLFRGASSTWPSVPAAKDAVEEMSDRVDWRETTPGVWTARADGHAPADLDRSIGRSRRPEAPRPPVRASGGGVSYNAALVLRGTGPS